MADATPQSRDDDVKFATLDFVGDNYLTRSPMARRQLGQTNTQLRRHIGEARNDAATRIQASMKTPLIPKDVTEDTRQPVKALTNMRNVLTDKGHNLGFKLGFSPAQVEYHMQGVRSKIYESGLKDRLGRAVKF